MYLVTGATGNVGRAIVEQLLRQGERVRVFVRSAERAARWTGSRAGNGAAGHVEVAVGDFAQPASFGAAFEGVEAAFLMSPGANEAHFDELLHTARQKGVRRVVFLSTMLAGISGNPVGDRMREKEEAIAASGLEEVVFLRPGGFMSNIFQWAPTIQSESIIYNPMGTGEFPPIAPEDIAAVAVAALRTEQKNSPQVHILTGSELVTVPKQAEILSRLLGRPLRVIDITTEMAAEQMMRSGLPAPVATGVAKSLEMVRLGHAAQRTDTVERLTGRPPISFAAWVEQHRSRFS